MSAKAALVEESGMDAAFIVLCCFLFTDSCVFFNLVLEFCDDH